MKQTLRLIALLAGLVLISCLLLACDSGKTPDETVPDTAAPTAEPTAPPTEEPTEAPTEEPTEAPTETPTETPTEGETAPAEKKGCGATLTALTALTVTLTAAVALKKKED